MQLRFRRLINIRKQKGGGGKWIVANSENDDSVSITMNVFQFFMIVIILTVELMFIISNDLSEQTCILLLILFSAACLMLTKSYPIEMY